MARLLAPLEDDRLAAFVAALDEVNAEADRAPGFVWRHQDASGSSTAVRPHDDPMLIINFSVWESNEALEAYTFGGEHVRIMRRRREFFEKLSVPYHVLWWIPAGTEPTVPEAMARLDHLVAHGPTPHAFAFRKPFPPPADPMAR